MNERLRQRNDLAERDGAYVLYWMQQAQRAVENPALELAAVAAARLAKPLVVGFGLTADWPEANRRHYTFMLEGLRETAAALAGRGIAFVLRLGPPERVALDLGRKAALIVCDRGYLRHQRRWRRTVAREADCRVLEVETDTVVPVDLTSDKAEYAARTLRPKIMRRLDEHLAAPAAAPPPCVPMPGGPAGEDPQDVAGLLARLGVEHGPKPVTGRFRGGTAEAERRCEAFLARRLDRYAAHANQPQTDDVSEMSPYLHFGQISPSWLARRVRAAAADEANRAAYIEELVVRRELAINFVVHREADYDGYACLPEWARRTLAEHRRDPRPHLYTPDELAAGKTHDPYWNAAMAEMRHTGFMHNYMRMYWGKKVLEWSESPEAAYDALLRLNNRYFLDGRDPNSYAGVGWIFGLHDRAWPERPVYGKVRTMTAAGLRRKCDIAGYVRKVEALAGGGIAGQ